MTIAYRFLLRRGLAATLALVNEVPLEGEMVIETDTRKFKFGDGSTAWNSLSYSSTTLDSDLVDIAALTPSNDDFLQRKSGAWTNRTVAQVKADLGLGTAPIEVDVPAGSAVSLTSGSAVDIGHIDLTVGTWLVTGNVAFYPAGGTDMSILRAWISDTSATQPSPPNNGAFQQLVLPFSTGSGQSLSAGSILFVVASGTTRVYLGTRCTFATSTLTAGGHLIATRVT